MRRGERVRVKLLAKVNKWFQGRAGTVVADSGPGEVVLVSLDGHSAVQHFLAKDLERIG